MCAFLTNQMQQQRRAVFPLQLLLANRLALVFCCGTVVVVVDRRVQVALGGKESYRIPVVDDKSDDNKGNITYDA